MRRSLQGRLVTAFLLFILLAMLSIGLLLLRGLERYFVEREQERQLAVAQQLAQQVAFLAAGGGVPPEEGLRPLLVDFAQAHGVQAVLLDETGTILLASAPGREGQRFAVVSAVELLERRQPLAGTRLAPETGTPRVWAAAPVLATGPGRRAVGVVYVERDVADIYGMLGDIRWILLQTGLTALTLTALVGWLLARTVTRPIEALTAHAAAMAAGQFDRRIEVLAQDEIGRLAEMFNRLAARLQETLRAASEEKRKVEAILTHMVDGVVAFGADGRVLLVNPAARRLLGLPPDADPSDLRPAALWPELEQEGLLQQVLSAPPAPGEPPGRLYTLVRGPRTLRCVLAPIPGEGGSPGGAVLVIHDVTEIEQLEAMRREFVANVSHELRTPLTTVKSYVETLKEGVEDPATRARFLQVIEQEVERMVRLVRDLLDLAQLEQGRVEWSREYVRVGELAAQVVARLRAQWEEKGLRVTLERQPGEPFVYADPDRLQQVIVNLLANAIEFTPPQGRVAVRVAAADGTVRLEVEDTGVGIPPEDLPRVFERFYRVDKARSRRLGGTGLGLSIVKEIVEAHGGRVGIESEPGRGTRAWFTLPVEAEVGDEAATAREAGGR